MNLSEKSCVVFFAAALLLSDVNQVAAQVPYDSLRRGDVLRISAGGNRFSGRYRGLADSALVLSQEGTTRKLQLTVIDSLWTRHSDTRRTIKTGALIGGGVGIGVLGFLHLALCESNCGAHGTMFVVALGAVGGGGIGALVGSLFGSLAGDWRLLIPPRN